MHFPSSIIFFLIKKKHFKIFKPFFIICPFFRPNIGVSDKRVYRVIPGASKENVNVKKKGLHFILKNSGGSGPPVPPSVSAHVEGVYFT